jgi:hypothetical protein
VESARGELNLRALFGLLGAIENSKPNQNCIGYCDSERSPFLSSKFHSLSPENSKSMRARKRGEF